FPALDHDVRTVSAEDTERGEARVLPLTLIVLVVAFGALVAAMLPVVVGLLAITIALGLVTIAARYLPMSVFVLNITTMVGLGVLVAVLLATTFLPALLAVLGRNIDRPRWLARPLARFHAPTGWERWARWLGHRPWRAVACGGVAITLLTLPLAKIRLGLPAT